MFEDPSDFGLLLALFSVVVIFIYHVLQKERKHEKVFSFAHLNKTERLAIAVTFVIVAIALVLSLFWTPTIPVQ